MFVLAYSAAAINLNEQPGGRLGRVLWRHSLNKSSMTGSKSSSSKTKYIDFIFMPSSRCVVQDCGNRADADAGISLHLSPSNSRQRVLWVRLVRTHRANFRPSGTFPVCSEHFCLDCCERSVHLKGYQHSYGFVMCSSEQFEHLHLHEKMLILNKFLWRVSHRQGIEWHRLIWKHLTTSWHHVLQKT